MIERLRSNPLLHADTELRHRQWLIKQLIALPQAEQQRLNDHDWRKEQLLRVLRSAEQYEQWPQVGNSNSTSGATSRTHISHA